MRTPATPLYRFNNLDQIATLFETYANLAGIDGKPERGGAFTQAADIVRRTTLMEKQP